MKIAAVALGLLRALLIASLATFGLSSVSFAQLNSAQTYVASSGGTNTITVTVPNVGSLTDLVGVPIRVYVTSSNTGAATLTVNSLAATAVDKPTTAGLAALTGGEIVANQINTFMLDSGGVFELIQPNLNITTIPASTGFEVPTNLQLNCSAAANALTCSIKAANTGNDPTTTAPVYIPFRDTTLTGGDPVWKELTASVGFTVSGGNNMGCSVNGGPCRLWITAINDAGTVLLGLSDQVNISTNSCLPLDEGALQTTGSGTGGGSTPGTIYTSISAVSTVAVRIIGYVEWNSIATAGDWTSPNKVQLFGPGIKHPCDTIRTLYNAPTTGSSGTESGYTVSSITPPAPSNGVSLVAQAIIPGSAANLLHVKVFPNVSQNDGSGGNIGFLYLYNGSTTLKTTTASVPVNSGSTVLPVPITLDYQFQAGSVSSTTYTAYYCSDASSQVVYINETDYSGTTKNITGGTAATSIEIDEIMG